MKPHIRLASRLMQWKLFSVLPGLLLAHAALATDPFYQNYADLNYVMSINPPPTLDGHNYLTPAFDNENQFNITYDLSVSYPEFYVMWNMLYYTNNGTMLADSSLPGPPGCGFQFDLHTTTGDTLAGTFYNAGIIHCNSLLDPVVINNGNSYLGECLVQATNIIMNSGGVVEVGPAGLIQFTGQNVDLTRATLSIESPQEFYTGYANLYAIGTVGTDTNSEWNPAADLTSGQAYSSWSGGGIYPVGYYVTDTNSTAYFQIVPLDGGTNYLIRAAFVQNNSPNAPYNVYFNGAGELGSGEVNIEWVGSYQDPATCNLVTNYLYLNNDYVQGAATNNYVAANGVPVNFTFTESATQKPAGTLATPGFSDVFPNGAFSNAYAYVNAQLVPSTTATNASAVNPSGALTNLPGRIQITASRELNLALARILGPNYLSLTSTNQFDGNTGVQIVSPYSDIHLGVTNGSLVFSNLLPQSIPQWSGTVQAWSTRWLVQATNIVGGVPVAGTNDFRVLIVNSQLVPTVQPVVQDLILHDTNSLVLSDALNILRTLSIDAQNLTLTTNGCGGRAFSLDGELNLMTPAILWPSALPNLCNLTNNGAIRIQNLAVFGGPPPANYTNFINHGWISDQGSTICANNFVSSGTISNGVGSFLLQSPTTVLTNGALYAGGDVSITTTSLETSNLLLLAGRALTLQVTNSLTDDGVSNGNFWSVGGSAVGGSDSGFNLPLLPNSANRSLLGTTVTNIAPANKSIINTWAGLDYGVTPAGYTNNMAIGRLILDSRTNAPNSQFVFNGTGVSNAIYVDELILLDYASYTNRSGHNLPALLFNTNLVIYYAQALTLMAGGSLVSVAEKLDGFNTNHLRWVPTYAGHFSSVYIPYPDGHTYGPFNAALAASTDIDSDGDGTVNANDPTPFFVASQVNYTATLVTNSPPLSPTGRCVRVQWTTVPLATNYIYYRTNLLSTSWLPFTGFDNYYYGANVAVANAAHANWFVSPQPWPSPAMNVWVFDPLTNGLRYYRVMVSPDLLY